MQVSGVLADRTWTRHIWALGVSRRQNHRHRVSGAHFFTDEARPAHHRLVQAGIPRNHGVAGEALCLCPRIASLSAHPRVGTRYEARAQGVVAGDVWARAITELF